MENYAQQYADIKKAMQKDEAAFNKIDRRLTQKINNEDFKVIDADKALQENYTFGKKLADQVAKVGGSWGFVISFIVFLVGWMIINVMQLFGWHFDPYPFILLNLALSCISAIQAPIIMMSQNRAGEKDDLDRRNDYHVNLRSEEELKLLHAKVDLQTKYNKHQSQLNQLQMEMLIRIEASQREQNIEKNLDNKKDD
ncbi:DUF1003 domain-containing protein [Apilactobacillus kunkeei]|uniref:DUF1003 domain-containing protein n=1 Tax=Apilactobacillus kunkeei TaxID=148814 RepID=UPI0006B24DBB|nr:DUF1003 domain-containing protein [Apilactobacillus kunkeei]KOY68201.1 Uncharacterized protein RZ73_12760 [Apilactobacillus kunkeei]CAI2657410.1 hypothetical protein AKUH3B109M_13340 [Apilactobacillus kunkeei]CAI2661739.1 hypothetical protein AKUH4B204J_14100 [Apilactobacillus kunkeei]CAI2662510.1 hypothetical protein AKUH3B102A_14260 [Apilactobacillus kunkeei]CAI2662786.1 hypothetical protein AKUH3B205J_14020 [Apilactobacillus kunkeei]